MDCGGEVDTRVFTQEEGGRRIGVSHSAYERMERAKKPRIETRRRIAQALGIDVHQLSL
ncbi:MAG: helix-turn-helix domain-containing protein [Sphaerochaeta sp.]